MKPVRRSTTRGIEAQFLQGPCKSLASHTSWSLLKFSRAVQWCVTSLAGTGLLFNGPAAHHHLPSSGYCMCYPANLWDSMDYKRELQMILKLLICILKINCQGISFSLFYMKSQSCLESMHVWVLQTWNSCHAPSHSGKAKHPKLSSS